VRLGGLAGVVVVPDGGSQGQDALEHPNGYASWGVPAVFFQFKLPLKVSLMDSMTWRSGLKNWCRPVPARLGGPDAAGRSGHRQVVSKSCP
jgi:hypothetical protein